ncbi:AraC family transcriptional regulator [Lacinutrix sp. 5H-3-7-4]|uniref:helix-turn-helix domain-containing protein n=1 Tax=Lacinutrix sp. (strain 5H-3-7-4) TaxID=983544 RepID=UPI00020A392F|nr:AraC family transcriptional regulator [Lacinutrix sp. 5H-3-7-4]AEH00157.1 transcriptional regulator, AraC family [Lacinutrix sp. 5H-3-7-4]
MNHILHIKNMVCNRCKMTIINLLDDEGFEVESIQLGKIVVKEQSSDDYVRLETQLNALGFEVIKDPTKALIEKIKINLIQHIEKNETDEILGKLESEIGKSYSTLSKTFSKSEGITLEKYFINLKIEKAKEYIQLNQLNFSEIAYNLNYKNSSHLSKQFKQVTGMSMTDYKSLQYGDRKSLDEIV